MKDQNDAAVCEECGASMDDHYTTVVTQTEHIGAVPWVQWTGCPDLALVIAMREVDQQGNSNHDARSEAALKTKPEGDES